MRRVSKVKYMFKSSIKPWKCLSKKLLHKTRVFDLMVQEMEKPAVDSDSGGGTEPYIDDYYFIECPDWNNIIALTSDGLVVLIEQFRHGVKEVCLEIPGGILDPGETPEEGAVRELAEETGYVPTKVESLGFVHPNPALQDNKCHFFLATDVELKLEPNLDSSEDIAVRLVPLEEVLILIEKGVISHALMISAFFKLFRFRERELLGA